MSQSKRTTHTKLAERLLHTLKGLADTGGDRLTETGGKSEYGIMTRRLPLSEHDLVCLSKHRDKSPAAIRKPREEFESGMNDIRRNRKTLDLDSLPQKFDFLEKLLKDDDYEAHTISEPKSCQTPLQGTFQRGKINRYYSRGKRHQFQSRSGRSILFPSGNKFCP